MHELQGVNERIKRQEERGGEMFFVEKGGGWVFNLRRTTQDAGRTIDR